MVYVPKVFVPPGQEQFTTASSAAPSSSSSQYPPQQQHQHQQQQQYGSYQPQSSYPGAAQRPTAAPVPVHHQQQRQNMPSFSQALDVLPPPVAPSHLARPAVASSMPPTVQGSYVSNKRQDEFMMAQGAAPYSSSMPSAPYYNTQQQQQQQQQYQYQQPPSSYAPNATGYYPTTTAVAVGYGNSNVNSSVYSSGGGENGMISEGNPTHCHKVDYQIMGNDMQLVEIELDPNETIVAEAGAMMYMEDGIEFKTKFGDGSTPNQGFFSKIMAAGGRILTGESLFLTHFTNTGNSSKACVAFAAPFPGTIMPINMGELEGHALICQKDAFLCAAKGTKLALYFNKRIGSGLFGGEGFLLQKLTGDGMAFIHAGGTVVKKELRGERLRVDTGCLVAFTSGIKFDIQMAPGLKTMIFGGEGIFLATLQGHGSVWIQSLPFSRMADRIVRAAPSLGGRQQDEGTALLGKLGPMISGEGFGGNAFKIPGI